MNAVTALTDTTLGELDASLAYKVMVLVATFDLPAEWQVLRTVRPGFPPGHTHVRTSLGAATLPDTTRVRVRPYP